MSEAHTAGNAWRYGLLGMPLAFVSLPLYISLPRYYAEHHAVPLATLGALLLGTRLLDALLDPSIGRWVDRLFAKSPQHGWWVALLAAIAMACGFFALWMPPQPSKGQSLPLLIWLGAALVVTYLAYSVITVVHQTWGARWGGLADQRARLIAWREGAALAGVLVASILPSWLGLNATSLALALSLAIGLWALHQTLPTQPQGMGMRARPSKEQSPWSNRAFSALLLVFLLNGTASAIPATLLPFFVRDTLQAQAWEPLFLGSFFLAAAAGLPLWLRLIGRLGLPRAWLIGMGISMAAFCVVPMLGPGDTLAFLVVCVLTGLALGADLAIPGAILTGVIHQSGLGQQSEGRFLGWWTAATKLNLALASGLSLPLLAMVGFETGRQSPQDQQALALAYGLLPCVFKLLAAWALWHGMRHHPALKAST
jgi:GPH family glycoside/pentoside/hexuronide:cation symporter